MRQFVALAATGCILAGCAEPIDIDYSGPVDDWPAYGSGPGGGHYSAAMQIHPGNVDRLVEVWRYQSPDHRKGGEELIDTPEGDSPSAPSGFQVTPILFNETLYLCTPFNRVVALDPATGVERWSYDPQIDTTKELSTNCRGVSSWQAPAQSPMRALDQSAGQPGACAKRIILGTLDGRLIVLDADSGKPCEDFGKSGEVDLADGLGEHHPAEHQVTSPPAILDNKIILGAMIVDNAHLNVPGGVVRAYDVLTGELLWYWDPIPPGREARLGHSAGQRYERGTTNVWSIISVDTERNLVFLPTGNTASDYYGGHREQELDYYSSSVVALDGDTGAVVWHFQMVHHDIWDFDTPSQPTFFDFIEDGKRIPALAQAIKHQAHADRPG